MPQMRASNRSGVTSPFQRQGPDHRVDCHSLQKPSGLVEKTNSPRSRLQTANTKSVVVWVRTEP